MEPTDQSLIDAVNRGPPEDKPAFEALYGRHRGFVYRVALRFINDPTLAADAMQDAFVAFYGKFPGFVLQGSLTTYLYAVARNCALVQGRKWKPGGNRLETGTTGQEFPAEFGPLRLAVDGLPDAQREVLLMRVVDGMTVGEVAIALGIPTGTVKSRLHSALVGLRADPRAADYFDDEEISETR